MGAAPLGALLCLKVYMVPLPAGWQTNRVSRGLAFYLGRLLDEGWDRLFVEGGSVFL